MFLIGVGTAVVLGLMSLLGAGANYFGNKALQEDAQEHQLYMSNTAYQRSVADIKEAGLNPNLLLSNGGAAVSGSSHANSVRGNEFSSSISNYLVNSALSKQNFEQQLILQNDKQAFIKSMSDNKSNSALTGNILDKMEKL